MATIKKTEMHPRNKHNTSYDFDVLCNTLPQLTPYVFINKYENKTIDFSNAKAVLNLNKALLAHYYGIENWSIPENYLCPPIPSRADYIHNIADVMMEFLQLKINELGSLKILDVGVGASCIYPIIGVKEYGWKFVGSDINPMSIKNANEIISSNETLKNNVELRLQFSAAYVFKGIVAPNEKFDCAICNPPFHSSQAQVEAKANRKWKGLNKKIDSKNKLNFGGQDEELWCEGGEKQFVERMINESKDYKDNIKYFSTLISNEDNIPKLMHVLKSVNATIIEVINMGQGQKISRVLFWSF